jgi:hypothetical protein
MHRYLAVAARDPITPCESRTGWRRAPTSRGLPAAVAAELQYRSVAEYRDPLALAAAGTLIVSSGTRRVRPA